MGVFCDNCGQGISTGSPVFTFSRYLKERNYCSYECARKALSERLDDVMSDISSEGVLESEDPYERYGVSRRDF